MEYILFDEELWKEGQCYLCDIQQDSIVAVCSEQQHYKKAVYISDCIDSGEKEMLWNRMCMNIEKTEQIVISVSYFATDTLEMTIKNQKMLLTDYLKSDISMEQKLYFLENNWQKTIQQQHDILLFEAKGRYLYFKIEILQYAGNQVSISNLKIDFPRQNMAKYLPSFYDSNHKNNSFLKRFLAVFYTMLYDMQQKIDNVSEYFIPNDMTTEHIQWLADCMAMPQIVFWEKAKAVKFLQRAYLLYQKKGTKQGISMIVELYTGKKPFIVENYEILQHSIGTPYEKEYKQLYGEDIYTFFVLVEQQYLEDYSKYGELKKILELFQPAHTKSEIIVLRPFMVFGQHCYIGVNSCILNNTALQLDDTTILPFQTALLK